MPIKNDWIKNKKNKTKEKDRFEEIEKYLTEEKKEILKTKRLKSNHYKNKDITENYKKELIKNHNFEIIKENIIEFIIPIIIILSIIIIAIWEN